MPSGYPLILAFAIAAAFFEHTVPGKIFLAAISIILIVGGIVFLFKKTVARN